MRLSLAKKLSALVVGLQIVSICGVVALAARLIALDHLAVLRKGTRDTAFVLATRIQAELKYVADRARLLGAASLETFRDDKDRLRFVQEHLVADAGVISLALYRPAASGIGYEPMWRLIHPDARLNLGINEESYGRLDHTFPLNFAAASKGTVDSVLAPLGAKGKALRLAIPFVQKANGLYSRILVLELQPERLSALFAESSAYPTCLVDRRGKILASTDSGRFPIGTNLRDTAVYSRLSTSGNIVEQLEFKDSQGELQIGTLHRVGFGELAVLSHAPTQTARLTQKELYRRTAMLGAAFLALGLVLGWACAQGASHARAKEGSEAAPVQKQAKAAASKSAVPKADVPAARLGLNAFKFRRQEILEALSQSKGGGGGERRTAAVLSVDVRGFSAVSKKLDPKALVILLNRYLSRMAQAIGDHGGTVDKTVGKSILAFWGLPMAQENDCERAVLACLDLRKALAELNEDLAGEGIPALRIGMGLGFGTLIAGNMGPADREEYSVIGETADIAARLESLTRDHGTDLLISQAVFERLGKRFITQTAGDAELGGKAGTQIVHKVQGYYDDRGAAVLVQTPYSGAVAEKAGPVREKTNPSLAKPQQAAEKARPIQDGTDAAGERPSFVPQRPKFVSEKPAFDPAIFHSIAEDLRASPVASVAEPERVSAAQAELAQAELPQPSLAEVGPEQSVPAQPEWNRNEITLSRKILVTDSPTGLIEIHARTVALEGNLALPEELPLTEAMPPVEAMPSGEAPPTDELPLDEATSFDLIPIAPIPLMPLAESESTPQTDDATQPPPFPHGRKSAA